MNPMTNGEILASLVAKGLAGECGPSGGEDPIVCGNAVRLESQCPATDYIFNDNGSVDLIYPDPVAMYNCFVQDCGMDEEEAEYEVDHPPHYNTIEDLFDSEDGWFYYFRLEHEVLANVILGFVEVIKNEEANAQND